MDITAVGHHADLACSVAFMSRGQPFPRPRVSDRMGYVQIGHSGPLRESSRIGPFAPRFRISGAETRTKKEGGVRKDITASSDGKNFGTAYRLALSERTSLLAATERYQHTDLRCLYVRKDITASSDGKLSLSKFAKLVKSERTSLLAATEKSCTGVRGSGTWSERTSLLAATESAHHSVSVASLCPKGHP